MPTISDVALLAGVSTATVSRVLNGIAVKPDLKKAVELAVEELRYSPSRTAQSLRRKASLIIGLILPDIENPYFTTLARGVEDVAQAEGFSVVLCNSDDKFVKEMKYLQIAVDERMAGVIVAPASARTSIGILASNGLPVVAVDRPVLEDVDFVTEDNQTLGRKGVDLLVARGFSRIACVTGPCDTLTARERADGWRMQMLQYGLEAPDELLVRANFKVDGGRMAVSQLLSLPSPPQAILATNNLEGVGALQVLAKLSGSFPPVSVGILGELPFATSDTSEISIIPLHPRQMGLMAAKLLVDRIGDKTETDSRRITLPVGSAPGMVDF